MLLDHLNTGALGFYCRAAGLDPSAVLSWVRGEAAINWTLAQLIEKDIGVPADAWPRIHGRPRGRPRKMPASLVAYKSGVLQRTREPLNIKEHMTPEEAARRIRWGKDWRKSVTRVHQVLDELGWSIQSFTTLVNEYLAANDSEKRSVSRASMQFYAGGERTGIHRGKRRAVAAPMFVRRAGEVVSKGRLKLSDWPNTEDEDA